MALVFNEVLSRWRSTGFTRLSETDEALWGHNLARDSRVDGASMKSLGASEL